jgi:hypothetical protein
VAIGWPSRFNVSVMAVGMSAKCKRKIGESLIGLFEVFHGLKRRKVMFLALH